MINVEGEKLTERRLLEKTNSEFLKHLKKKKTKLGKKLVVQVFFKLDTSVSLAEMSIKDKGKIVPKKLELVKKKNR